MDIKEDKYLELDPEVLSKKGKEKSRLKKWILATLVFLFTFFSFFLYFSLYYLLGNWNELTVDEILYHVKAPMGGANGHLVQLFLQSVLLPSSVIILLLFSFFILLKRWKAADSCSASSKEIVPEQASDIPPIKRGLFHALSQLMEKKKSVFFPLLTKLNSYYLFLCLCLGLFFFILTIADAWESISLGNYIVSQIQSSDFIEENYVDPREIELHFPEKKRNLVYIYMESTELTFMDEKHGGAFPENLLPEMNKLSLEGEDFSGEGEKRNGGISLPGATWTMGAIFGQSTGLPLKISIEQNSMDSQKNFFPSVVSIQDILKEEGYTQKFLLGSVGYFGGRELFMKDHGDVQVEDFSYWKRKNKFPRDYWVNWGFEKLYNYAKEELLSRSKEGKPFNLTLLTVDTHFPDGYVCRLCKNTYPDNQYANVFNCASRQVTEFVHWIKEQDFYDNTTIVISGDHPTMDRDFCDNVPKSYQRKVYTVFLNSAVTIEEKKEREYSTFDYFPTTLAAMGVEIPGERLGLGTNLFSKEPTLTEKYGKKEEKKELEKRSDFMIRLGGIDKDTAFKQKEEKELRKKKEKEIKLEEEKKKGE